MNKQGIYSIPGNKVLYFELLKATGKFSGKQGIIKLTTYENLNRKVEINFI